eukprot:scaffold2367_cov58-Phaeocystis_antarctica.AAC.10
MPWLYASFKLPGLGVAMRHPAALPCAVGPAALLCAVGHSGGATSAVIRVSRPNIRGAARLFAFRSEPWELSVRAAAADCQTCLKGVDSRGGQSV